MSEANHRTIVTVDAAGPPYVDGPLSRNVLTFVRDVTRFAAKRNEPDARRILCSPFSGVPALDARALCIAAGERHDIAETVALERVPLGHESALAARRYVRALSSLQGAYRAQGASAREHVATIRAAFDLDATLDATELRTIDAVDTLAARCDAARLSGVAWEAAPLVAAIEDLADRLAAVRDGVAAWKAERAPLPACDAEPPRVVKRRRGHFSASSLGAYAECQRRWYYRYVCAAVEDRGSSASFYGTAFHWALENFHKEFKRADSASPELLERKLDAYLATSFEHYRSGFDTNVEYELQRRRAKRTGRRYLAWFLERARRHPFTVIGTEATVELELDGYRFIGYIDRLDRDDATDSITVVDYKTGNIAESAREYREKIARFVDFQLPFYYWARTAIGDRVTRLALVPLKDASQDVRPIELEVVPVAAPRGYDDAPLGTIGIDELERARTRMIEVAALLADGPIENFPVTSDPNACTYCAYIVACRDRPLQREDRFGR